MSFPKNWRSVPQPTISDMKDDNTPSYSERQLGWQNVEHRNGGNRGKRISAKSANQAIILPTERPINLATTISSELADLGSLTLDDESFPSLSVSVGQSVVMPENSRSPKKILHQQPPTAHLRTISKAGQSRTVEFSALLTPPRPKAPTKQTEQPTAAASSSSKRTVGSLHDPAVKGNALDTTVPTRLRGKEKITPKRKNPSALKKAILKSRQANDSFQPDVLTDRAEAISDSSPADDQLIHDLSLNYSDPSTPSANTSGMTANCPKRDRTFYCTHVINPEITVLAGEILEKLVFYQDRAHKQDPLLYKRRFVCGFRDVAKHVDTEIKLIFLATDLERADEPGGITEQLTKIREKAATLNVPVVFVGKRRILAKKCKKPHIVSIIGIYNYDVAHEPVKKLLALSAIDQPASDSSVTSYNSGEK